MMLRTITRIFPTGNKNRAMTKPAAAGIAMAGGQRERSAPTSMPNSFEAARAMRADMIRF